MLKWMATMRPAPWRTCGASRKKYSLTCNCHCEERSDEAIPDERCTRRPIQIGGAPGHEHTAAACPRHPAGQQCRPEAAPMKVSYFETGRYVPPPDMPREWPVPSGSYDPDVGAAAFRGMVERVKFVEQLGFDWVSVSEHHYSPRILTPSPIVSATWLASRTDKIKIAMLGPIVPVNNPIRIAEEMAMLDTR